MRGSQNRTARLYVLELNGYAKGGDHHIQLHTYCALESGTSKRLADIRAGFRWRRRQLYVPQVGHDIEQGADLLRQQVFDRSSM